MGRDRPDPPQASNGVNGGRDLRGPSVPVRGFFVALSLVAIFLIVFILAWLYLGASVSEIAVPDLVGLDRDEAASITRSAGLLPEFEEMMDESAETDTVIRQRPAPGSMVKPGRTVTLFVAVDVPLIPVPDIVGLRLPEAVNLLARAGRDIIGSGGGFEIGERTEISSDTAAPGSILAQDPLPGEEREAGSLVDIIIAVAPEDTRPVMPDLRGMRLDEAEALLANLSARITRVERFVTESEPEGTIIAFSPPMGFPIDPEFGTDVEVTVAAAPPPAWNIPRFAIVPYAVPPGGIEHEIVIIIVENDGSGEREREVYRGTPPPGTRIEIPVRVVGRARAKIYADGLLLEQWEI